jgi:magnesium transporter
MTTSCGGWFIAAKFIEFQHISAIISMTSARGHTHSTNGRILFLDINISESGRNLRVRKRPLISLNFFKMPSNRGRFKVKAKQVGLPPGTLVHVGQKKTDKPVITLIDYDQTRFEAHSDISIEEATAFKETATVSWINVSGIHDTSLIDAFGRHFDIHPLALEDILNTHHRPKIDEYEGFSLVILKMLFYDDQSQAITAEQISIVLGKKFVLSFQETDVDVFDVVRERIQRGNGKIRQRGPDYLAYALIDSIVDSYFHILEKVGDHLEQIEDELISNPDAEPLSEIYHYKRELLLLRKSVWPLREVINQMHKEISPLITKGTQIYLRDLYDHTIQVIDTMEIFRDGITSLQDLYITMVSNRMNEIMKVLTIMASIFIPMTFIAGVYGMNFEYMPELKWHWGYFTVWGFMVCCAIGMIIYFRKKKWL